MAKKPKKTSAKAVKIRRKRLRKPSAVKAARKPVKPVKAARKPVKPVKAPKAARKPVKPVKPVKAARKPVKAPKAARKPVKPVKAARKKTKATYRYLGERDTVGNVQATSDMRPGQTGARYRDYLFQGEDVGRIVQADEKHDRDKSHDSAKAVNGTISWVDDQGDRQWRSTRFADSRDPGSFGEITDELKEFAAIYKASDFKLYLTFSEDIYAEDGTDA